MNNEQHYCQINKNSFALAAGGVMGAIYVICAIFVALWPDFRRRLDFRLAAQSVYENRPVIK